MGSRAERGSLGRGEGRGPRGKGGRRGKEGLGGVYVQVSCVTEYRVPLCSRRRRGAVAEAVRAPAGRVAGGLPGRARGVHRGGLTGPRGEPHGSDPSRSPGAFRAPGGPALGMQSR